MIRAIVFKPFDSTKAYAEYAGLNDDTKPLTGIITGSKYFEVDTGDTYYFDEKNSEWNKIPPDPDPDNTGD